MRWYVLQPFCQEGVDVAIGDVLQLTEKDAGPYLRLKYIRPATQAEAKRYDAAKDHARKALAKREAERVSVEGTKNAEELAQSMRDRPSGEQGNTGSGS